MSLIVILVADNLLGPLVPCTSQEQSLLPKQHFNGTLMLDSPELIDLHLTAPERDRSCMDNCRVSAENGGYWPKANREDETRLQLTRHDVLVLRTHSPTPWPWLPGRHMDRTGDLYQSKRAVWQFVSGVRGSLA